MSYCSRNMSKDAAVFSLEESGLVVHISYIIYGGEFTVMNFVTSDYRLIIPWYSRWRYIMTSPVMTHMVALFKD